MEVKPGLWDPQNFPFPLNRGNRYKDYGDIFLGPTFVSPEWRCPLNRGVLIRRFHCSRDKQNRKRERKRKKSFRVSRRKGSSPQCTSEFLASFSFTSCDSSSCLLFVSFLLIGTDYRLSQEPMYNWFLRDVMLL